jgi:Taurine catabolism dioxygenase TauD, TfdA family
MTSAKLVRPFLGLSSFSTTFLQPHLHHTFSRSHRYLSTAPAKQVGTIDPSTLFKDFPLQYLRAMDTSNFDPHTSQRTNVQFDTRNGKITNSNNNNSIAPSSEEVPSIAQCTSDGSHYYVTWRDGQTSKYPIHFLEKTVQVENGRAAPYPQRVLWKDMTEEKIRTTENLCPTFQYAITDDGMNTSLRALYEYGFVLITNTPTEDQGAGVAALASALGGGCHKDDPSSLLMQYRSGNRNQIMLSQGTDGPLRTLYGTVWSTSSSGQAVGTSIADSSYGCDALPLHTDMTYRYDPPGLQIFTMIQPAQQGGESIVCDGFAVASHLRETDPEAFQILCETKRRYHCIDHTTGWHMEASGPIITLDNHDQIAMIRHNDLDRLPVLPPPGTRNVNEYYTKLQTAHDKWDQLLTDDSYRLILQLQPGDTIVVANQVRCDFCWVYSLFNFP